MKLARMPAVNRLQAVETILDRNVQLKDGPKKRELEEALRLTRSLQRTLFGSHYVRERSLKRFSESPETRAKKANWEKVQRERELKQNGDLRDHTNSLEAKK